MSGRQPGRSRRRRAKAEKAERLSPRAGGFPQDSGEARGVPDEPADQGSPGREVEERSPEEPKRPAGVQPSRKTHRPGGFYAGFLTAQDRQDLSAAVSIGLEDEIAILKVSLRKLLAMFDDVENLREAVALSSQIGATAARIGQLEKVQHSLYDRTRTASDAVSLALSEVMQELKIHI